MVQGLNLVHKLSDPWMPMDLASLRSEHSGFGLLQLTGFDIEDVSNNGLEVLNYRVADYEENRVNFYCKSIIVIDAKVVTELTTQSRSTKHS